MSNGDFEFGFATWGTGQWWGGQYTVEITEDCHAGKYAARISCREKALKGAISGQGFSTMGKTNVLSFGARPPDRAGGRFQLLPPLPGKAA
jgi:hypothetical protein